MIPENITIDIESVAKFMMWLIPIIIALRSNSLSKAVLNIAKQNTNPNINDEQARNILDELKFFKVLSKKEVRLDAIFVSVLFISANIIFNYSPITTTSILQIVLAYFLYSFIIFGLDYKLRSLRILIFLQKVDEQISQTKKPTANEKTTNTKTQTKARH